MITGEENNSGNSYNTKYIWKKKDSRKCYFTWQTDLFAKWSTFGNWALSLHFTFARCRRRVIALTLAESFGRIARDPWARSACSAMLPSISGTTALLDVGDAVASTLSWALFDAWIEGILAGLLRRIDGVAPSAHLIHIDSHLIRIRESMRKSTANLTEFGFLPDLLGLKIITVSRTVVVKSRKP